MNEADTYTKELLTLLIDQGLACCVILDLLLVDYLSYSSAELFGYSKNIISLRHTNSLWNKSRRRHELTSLTTCQASLAMACSIRCIVRSRPSTSIIWKRGGVALLPLIATRIEPKSCPAFSPTSAASSRMGGSMTLCSHCSIPPMRLRAYDKAARVRFAFMPF